jgi:thiol-disulfide isomerase/thioredoxin
MKKLLLVILLVLLELIIWQIIARSSRNTDTASAVPVSQSTRAESTTEHTTPNENPPASQPVNLYAKDFRGQPAPQLVVEKWLTPQPDTASKVMLLEFWATWCGPCVASIPDLNDFAEKFRDDLVIIAISGEPPATIEEFREKTRMNYYLAVDTNKSTSKTLDVTGIPHSLVISSDGIVRWQGFPKSSTAPLTAEIIQEIIAADAGVKIRHEGLKRFSHNN